ncbi:MAG: hypothetical protein K5907_08415, partial [Treponema sp.]|nr:hypothetical protein [Treponema sp.]
MNPEEKYILYKFNDSNNYMEEIGYVPLTYAEYPQQTDTFKMAACDNYIFIAYNYGYSGQEQSFNCDVFTESNKTGNKLNNCWQNGEYELYYESISGFSNKSFRLNDIIAVSNTIGSNKPDLYVLLGTTNITNSMMPGMEDSGCSYGGIIKIITEMEGDNFYKHKLDTQYGYRYLYKATENLPLYSNDSSENFYNPIKFVGKNSDNYIIADDGAIIQGGQGKNGFTITNTQNVNRVLTVNITAPSEIEDPDNPGTYIAATIPDFVAEDVNVSFDNNVEGISCYNYKNLAANGQQTGSSSMFTDIEPDSSNIVLADGVTVELYKKDKYGYFEDMSTEILPAKRGEPLYFITTPELPSATYQAVLYCNGKDLNKDGNGNLLSEDEQYYYIDSQAGTLTLNKPLPCIGYEYKLEIDIINQVVVEGKTTTIHNDVTMDVYPATEFEIRFPKSLQSYYDLLDNLLVADYATVKLVVNAYTGTNFEPPYTPAKFVTDLVSHFNEHPCDCLTLDLSDDEMTGLTEITEGMFAINCSCIKLPKKIRIGSQGNYKFTESVETIRAGAFSKNGICFQGDLVIHKSVQTIESGAFEVPPRSITIDNSGWAYNNASSESTAGKYIVTSIMNKTGVYDVLMDYQGGTCTRVITCTKRDEPFEVDLTRYSSFSQIDANAFRGLPVTKVELGTLTVDIGDNAFKDTPVEGTF